MSIKEPIPPIAAAAPVPVEITAGPRKNGKPWKPVQTPFKPGLATSRKSYLARQVDRTALLAVKAREKELKDEKAAAKKEMVDKIKERREKKEEKIRFEKIAAKMHAKKVERLRKREKRNKALKER